MNKQSKKKYFEEIKKDMLLGIASGAIVGLLFVLGDGFSDLAKEYGLKGGWVFVVKTLVSCVGIILVMNRIEKKKFK